jgi:hypothetical protein
LTLFGYNLGTIWYTVHLFVHNYLFLVAIVRGNDYWNLQEVDFQDFEQQLVGEQGK